VELGPLEQQDQEWLMTIMQHSSLAYGKLETRWAPPGSESKAIDRRPSQGLSIALVHDWCPHFRGGERVLANLCRTFEATNVYTIFDFLDEKIKAKYFPNVNFHTSPVNTLPLVEKYYRALFFSCPFLIEQFDVTEYDAVISSSAAFARGIVTRPDQPHLCYVHSPIRYAWDEQFSYLARSGLRYGPAGLLFRYMLHRLRTWDTRTAHGPDLMVANSSYVKARVKRIYGRDAEIVHPPVDMEELEYESDKDDYYVTASFLAPYKRVDLVTEAFGKMPTKRLIVVGEGQQLKSLRAMAGPNVTFTGHLSRPNYVKTISRARAFVFAGCEDFGIALAEAQACGTPLIAFGRGGARDIVRSLSSRDPTGVLFTEQSADAVRNAVEQFENCRPAITASACRENAMRFTAARFQTEMARAFDMAQTLHAKAFN
jgi:glycosyltransferase involved in cell wall biosynthesis